MKLILSGVLENIATRTERQTKSNFEIMENLAIVTLKQSDYNLIMGQLPLLDIVPISVKIIPDDSEIKENPIYKEAVKKRRKAQKEEDEIRFNLTTNSK